MGGDTTELAALGIMATIVGVLVWLLKKLFTQNETTLKEGNKANIELARSITRLSVASENQIQATHESREEQREFQKLVVAKLDSIDDKADRNYTAIVKQTVKEQTVEHQTVKSTN